MTNALRPLTLQSAAFQAEQTAELFRGYAALLDKLAAAYVADDPVARELTWLDLARSFRLLQNRFHLLASADKAIDSTPRNPEAA